MSPPSCCASDTCRARAVIRHWWPVVAIFAGSIVIQTVALSNYEARGHAGDHLGSAKFIFLAAALIATILWAAPRARRQPDVLVAAAAWLAAAGAFAAGNLRVVDAIGGADWTSDEADLFGPALPGFESGHDLAALAAPLGLVAALVLAVVLWRRAHVSPRAAVAACAGSVVIPYFLIPGAGVAVLAVATCRRRAKTRDAGQ